MYMDRPTYLRIIQTTRAPRMTLSDDQLLEMYLLANKSMIDYAEALMKLQITFFNVNADKFGFLNSRLKSGFIFLIYSNVGTPNI